MDHGFCLVLPIGDWEGGELCLYEPGLAVKLENGHFAIFRSSEVTHFNLCFKGSRASFVLSTDKALEDWNDGRRNGWASNSYSR